MKKFDITLPSVLRKSARTSTYLGKNIKSGGKMMKEKGNFGDFFSAR